jgi:hypothetical protein
MNRINKFETFIYEAGTLAAAGSKMRRVVTGQSAGDEIQKLSDSQQQKLIDLYRQDPTEAARYLRSIIIKEKNSQFGLGLALAIAGAGMIYKAANWEPPKPKVEDGDFVTVKEGDGITQTVNRIGGTDLSPKSSPEDFMDAVAKTFGKGDYNAGVENLVKGVSGPDKAEILATLKSLGANPHEHGDTLGEIFTGKWSGTGKSINDLLDWDLGSKVWVPK